VTGLLSDTVICHGGNSSNLLSCGVCVSCRLFMFNGACMNLKILDSVCVLQARLCSSFILQLDSNVVLNTTELSETPLCGCVVKFGEPAKWRFVSQNKKEFPYVC
jgi:hypothetical protein